MLKPLLPTLLLASLVAVVFLVLNELLRARPGRACYSLRPSVLTPAELSFFHVLRSITPYYIAPKVRLADFLTVSSKANYQAAFNRIAAKHVDFLLCDPRTMQPVLAIELDDKSHNRRNRKDRDALVDAIYQQAALPVMHFPALTAYQPQAVKQAIDAHTAAHAHQ